MIELEAVVYLCIASAIGALGLGLRLGLWYALRRYQRQVDHGDPCWRCQGTGLEDHHP